MTVFPYFGGKSQAADLVWSRFGDVRNYVEPFCGSCAVLLARPHWPFEANRIETVNDANCYLANFWRALSRDPDAVADWCDWPVNEADCHARHLWLVQSGAAVEFREKMRTDPDHFDAKIAGWWVWGQCLWIGSGWCERFDWQQLPHLGNAGRGVHRPLQKLPHLGDAGMGVHRPSQQRPHLGDAGRGVHRPSQKRPHLGNPNGHGLLTKRTRGDLFDLLHAVAERLRRVRVCCGDWSRVLGPTPTTTQGLTGVFLDPPYADTADRAGNLYAVDSLSVAHAVREWAIEHGDNPEFRIALCGYEGEHAMPDSWECVPWKAKGGYGSQSNGRGRENSGRERLWFSPHCLRPRPSDVRTFAFAEDEE